MNQESKYYSPEIEEFHVGFEFECSNGYKKWVKRTFNNGECAEQYCYEEDGRVKYLDADDIISLGFKKANIPNVFNNEDHEIVEGFEYMVDKGNFVLLYHYGANTKIASQNIYNEHSGNWTSEVLFQGTIKNKSELKKILHQTKVK
jgi:hypothetical protein